MRGEEDNREEETRLQERAAGCKWKSPPSSCLAVKLLLHYGMLYGGDGGCVVPEVGLGKLHPVQPQWRCAKSLIVDAS